LAAAFAQPAGAAAGLAGTMTLEGVLSTIRAANPELSAMRARIAGAAAASLKDSAYPNPSLEMEQSRPDSSQSGELRLTQPIVMSRRRSLARGAARAEIGALKKELLAKEAVLSAAAKKDYFALRLAEERIRFEESNRTFALNVLNKVQARLLVGEARTMDAARAKVELDLTRFHLEEAKARMLLARARLNEAMGRRPDEPLSFPADDPNVLQPPQDERDFDRYLAEALAGRLDIQAAGLRQEAAGLSLRLERNRRRPDVSIGFARARESSVCFNKFSLGVELPLWYRNKGEVESAQARVSVRDEERRGAERAASYEVYSSWLGRSLARTRISVMKKNVLAVDELRENNSREYLSGKIDLTAYYEGNRIFLEQNLDYLDALQEYHDKDIELEQVLSASLSRSAPSISLQ
jgi:cobalt-zinc-cadmium efflux system outer membrane protein